MVAVGRIDELGADADLVARLAHAALEDGGDVELFPDGGYVLVLALERERRSARGHVQARYLRQQVQQLLAQPVGEVLLLLVGAEIDQRKHRHRGTRRRTRWRGPSHHEVVDGAGRRDEQADACERERHASSKGRAGGALDPPLVDVEDPGQHEHHWKTDRQRDHDVGEHRIGPMQPVHDGFDDLQNSERDDAVADERAKHAPAPQLGHQRPEPTFRVHGTEVNTRCSVATRVEMCSKGLADRENESE